MVYWITFAKKSFIKENNLPIVAFKPRVPSLTVSCATNKYLFMVTLYNTVQKSLASYISLDQKWDFIFQDTSRICTWYFMSTSHFLLTWHITFPATCHVEDRAESTAYNGCRMDDISFLSSTWHIKFHATGFV